MSTVAVHLAQPTLSASAKALFRALSRGAPTRSGFVVELRQHGGRGYNSGANVPTDEAPLPAAVLGILEKSASPWGVCLAVRNAGGGLATVPALAAHREFPLAYHNPSDPDSESGKQWRFPEADIAKWETSLDAWTLPPTMIVRALPAVWAVWALSATLPAETGEEQAAAVELLRALALATAAEAPGALADVEVPLVGTRCANQDLRVVTCPRLNEGRVYAASAIDAAMVRRK